MFDDSDYDRGKADGRAFQEKCNQGVDTDFDHFENFMQEGLGFINPDYTKGRDDGITETKPSNVW